MPLISYSCSCGWSISKYVKSAKDAAGLIDCVKCELKAKRGFGNVSSGHKIVIDNGIMGRAIEISLDIQEVNDERARRDYSEED
jgi:hypothetical protein